jgi:SNF2 family DNA or RNA helicase
VFTQFLQTLHRSEKLIKGKGIPLNILHGGMSIPQRNQSIKDFSEREGGGILLMTLKTGGVGLNLTKASYVFHLEPWWNPSVENQATDRVHRLGQKKAVQVFRYIMHESLEEKIEVLKGQKQARFNSLFEGVETEGEIRAGGPSLTRQDFEYLLS